MKVSDIFLIVNQLKSYSLSDLKSDLLAGIVLSIVVIPQGMAYAMMAGLPPQIGLYASILPLLAYALVGGSRFISMGPTGVVSLIVYSTTADLQTTTAEIVAISGGIAVATGLIFFVAGLLNLKFLDYVLSETVLKGFCMAAAIIISFSQLKTIFQVSVAHSDNFFHYLANLYPKIALAHMPSTIIGVLSVLFLVILRLISKKIPGGLSLIVVGIASSYCFDLSSLGIELVGNLPDHLPGFTMPAFELAHFTKVTEAAFVIFFIGFMEAFSVAKSLAIKSHTRVKVRRELFALGLSNILVGFFKGYPVGGSFSRSTMNYVMGVKSNLASIFSAVFLIIFILFFSATLSYLPKPCLAALIMVMICGLFDVKGARNIMRVRPQEGLLLLFTIFVTLVTSIHIGILISVLASFLLIIYNIVFPHLTFLAFSKTANAFVVEGTYPDCESKEGVEVIAIDSPVYFVHSAVFVNMLLKRLSTSASPKTVIFDASQVFDFDYTALEQLKELYSELEDLNITLVLVLKVRDDDIKELIEKSGVLDLLGEQNIYPRLTEAYAAH